MTDAALSARANNECEFCGASGDLAALSFAPGGDVLLCPVCRGEADPDSPAHWQCLQGAAWSAEPDVQFAVYRKLASLDESWATELRDTMVLSDDAQAWADAPVAIEHRDANGVLLERGDTVVLLKDLPVKGSSMIAKRGTAVRSIALVPDNAGQIEGKVDGQRIVILTEFVKKR
ncbi:PhnA domain-containing protein [Pararhodobacter zhoushanensis]|uniref:PhnA domain-containing protein n=1 Tax=Pararhodobacter zhoushanensis TaxID=2479545 RepID=UPI000F8EAC8C|nr:alkylphosphonate utilization protein [Pararhodobacter zhoushanensis]